MSHPAVELDYILGRKVEIDEAIAPLVQFIWQLDIRTASSCRAIRAASGRTSSSPRKT